MQVTKVNRLRRRIAVIVAMVSTPAICHSPMAVAENHRPQAKSHHPQAARNVHADPHRTAHVQQRKGMTGMASYYAKRFDRRITSSGRPYYKEAWTAAHRTLPMGTWVRVTNESNGLSAIVQITDRGPYAKKRIIDLSDAAATALDMKESGVAPVHLEIMPPPAYFASAESY